MIYIHLSQAALLGFGGVARVEGLGPHTLEQITQLVGHSHIDIKPVIDLAEGSASTPTNTPRRSRNESRTPHRARTHLGYRCTPLPTGEVLWRTPHGPHRIVDHTGTHHIDKSEYEAWLSDDPVDRALVRLMHRLHTGALSG